MATDSISPAAPAPLSEGKRLIGTLVSPAEVFPDIARNGRWFIPVVISMVLAFVLVHLMFTRISVEDFLQKEYDRNSQMQQMSAEQRAQVMDQQKKFMPVMIRGGALVGNLLVTLVVAAVFLFVFNFLLGSDIKYKGALNATAYSFFGPGVVMSALMLLVMYLKPADEFDIQNPLAFNVGAFLPEDAPRWLQSLGTSLDLFSFWIMALLALAFSVAGTKKLEFGKAMGAVIGTWLVYVLGKVGWAAVFG